jgi:CheY-like chemotaxis protein
MPQENQPKGMLLNAPGTAVLVVDDDAEITRFIGAVLRSRGHPTISAYDAADGFQVAQRQQPKLILVDWHMPQGGGPELLRRLRADQTTAAIPIVVVTGDSAPNIREEAASLGARRFLHKPLDPDSLADVVNSMVGASEL